MNVVFTNTGWNEYIYCQTQDKMTIQNINRLVKSIENDDLLKGKE
ncbi:MAG: type II toxin-antitoxin system YoeB family toxin [Erysipelotrichaceae bacterium]